MTSVKKVSQRGLLATAIMLPLILVFYSMADAASRTVPLPCGQNPPIDIADTDIDAIVNGDPPGTSTRFVLGNCTYIASATVVPREGDELVGPVGTYTQRDTAFDPSTTAIIRGSSSLAQVMKPQGMVIHGVDYRRGR